MLLIAILLSKVVMQCSSNRASLTSSSHIKCLADPYLIWCTLFFAKEPLFIWLFCGKRHLKTRYPMGLGHPVVIGCSSDRASSKSSSHIKLFVYLRIRSSSFVFAYRILSIAAANAKEPLITGLLCGKWPIKTRYPMGLRHPVHI